MSLRLPFNRRAFLKLSAAIGAACLQSPSLHLASVQGALATSGLTIASTYPLPFPHYDCPNVESLLTRRLAAFDLLLIPAYAAAELIRQGALQTIPGPPGRAHDPDGAFTIPHTYALSALVYSGAPPASLNDLWTRDALWPDSPRLVIGAALLRRGYRLNDTNPGHLAQAGEDLLRLRPRIVPDPLAGLRDGLGALALAPIAARREATEPFRIFLPPEGAALVEYDWVIPLGAARPQAALSFITDLPYASLFTPHASRLTPLTPLPAAACAQLAEIWARLKGLTP